MLELLFPTEFQVSIEIATGSQRTNPDDRFGTRQTPASSGTIQPILDQVTAGAFNHSRCNGEPIGQEGVILEHDTVFVQARMATTQAQIINSTFLNNCAARLGGAIFNGAPLKVINSTFHGNAADAGGAIVNEAEGVLTMTNCTLSGNIGRKGAGGVKNQGTATLRSTIVAGSTNDNCSNSGTLDDGGYNVEDKDTCGFYSAGSHSHINTDPLLSPPGSHSGQTWTLALLPNSPAIDMIPYGDNGCGTDIAFDQRGVRRPLGVLSACDIGAVESRGFMLKKTSGDHQSTPVNTPFGLSLRLLVSSSSGEPVEGGQVTFTGPDQGDTTNPHVNTATISKSGCVIQTIVASDTAGRYLVSGSARGAKACVLYDLTNKNNP